MLAIAEGDLRPARRFSKFIGWSVDAHSNYTYISSKSAKLRSRYMFCPEQFCCSRLGLFSSLLWLWKIQHARRNPLVRLSGLSWTLEKTSNSSNYSGLKKIVIRYPSMWDVFLCTERDVNRIFLEQECKDLFMVVNRMESLYRNGTWTTPKMARSGAAWQGVVHLSTFSTPINAVLPSGAYVATLFCASLGNPASLSPFYPYQMPINLPVMHSYSSISLFDSPLLHWKFYLPFSIFLILKL